MGVGSGMRDVIRRFQCNGQATARRFRYHTRCIDSRYLDKGYRRNECFDLALHLLLHLLISSLLEGTRNVTRFSKTCRAVAAVCN